MALTTPFSLEPAWQTVLSRCAPRTVDDRALGVMVDRMSRKYNGEDVPIAHGDELLARLLFWFPRDVHKIALPISELILARALPARPLRILDAGAGMGASSLGLLRALGMLQSMAQSIDVPEVQFIDAFDTDSDALRILTRIAQQAFQSGLLPVDKLPVLRTHVRDLSSSERFAHFPEAPYDLILLGSVLVELTRSAGDETARGAAMADILTQAIETTPLAPDGSVVVIEPASHAETRALHRAREILLARGFGIFAPCTHSDACPMLQRERDWCHEDLDVDLPPWLVPVARSAGLRWQGLTFSYLVIRRDSTRSVKELLPESLRSQGWVPARLVSAPIKSKGKTEAFASGSFSNGITGPRIMQLDRDLKSMDSQDSSTQLDQLFRGDLIGVAPRAAARAEPTRPIRVAPVELVRVSPGKTEPEKRNP
jgi:hypothetical protein